MNMTDLPRNQGLSKAESVIYRNAWAYKTKIDDYQEQVEIIQNNYEIAIVKTEDNQSHQINYGRTD